MNLKAKLKTFFCLLSGDDPLIIDQCSRRTSNLFAGIGVFVLAVFVLCFVSSYLSFTNLFPNYWVGIPIALFFAWMITNIYLLLLYTLSKNVLPHERARKTAIFSTTLRVLFICFIAVVISKPLEALIYAVPLENEIREYKRQKLAEYANGTEEFFAGEVEQLKLIIEKQKNLGGSGSQAQERIKKYARLLADKENQKIRLLADMQNLVGRSNFYVHGIVILNTKYPSCWILTLLSVWVFLAPAVIKNFISETSDFYGFKKRIEMDLVRREYGIFKTHYRRILQESFGFKAEFSESHLDPPFNTVPKIDRAEYLAESDLIKDLYDA